jgi:hypothetical protein
MKIDYEYEISEEQIRAYLKIPEIERLRWLEDICVLTNMFRQAQDVPLVQPSAIAEPLAKYNSQSSR